MKNLILFLLLLSSISFAQYADPKISPETMTYDFGDISEGEIVSHKFAVFNRGGDYLEISKVKASCGCTAANPTKEKIAPGDSTSILVKFNSTRRIGKQKKAVYIFSNDPETPQLRLTFTANVIGENSNDSQSNPALKLSEYNHNFGDVKEGEVLNLSVDMVNVGGSVLEIKNVKASCGCTATTLSNKKLSPNEKGQLDIKFDTKNLAGQVARTVTVYTNDRENPYRVVTLIANIERG